MPGPQLRLLIPGPQLWFLLPGPHVVLTPGVAADQATVERLQRHVKDSIAPFKYPRSVVFCDALPKTQTGKIQRFRLKQ